MGKRPVRWDRDVSFEASAELFSPLFPTSDHACFRISSGYVFEHLVRCILTRLVNYIKTRIVEFMLLNHLGNGLA